MIRVERRGRAIEAPGGREGGVKGEEGEGEEKEMGSGKKEEREGEGETSAKARRRGGKLQRRDPSRGIPYLSLCFPVSFYRLALPILPTVLWYTLSLIQPVTLGFPKVQLLSFPIGGKKFHDKKKSATCLSGYTPSLLCCLHRELKHHILPRQPAINGRK
jgi:hypothetical protein